MDLNSIRAEHHDARRRLVWSEALQLPQSLNEQTLALLIEIGDTCAEHPDWQEWVQLGRMLREIDSPARQSLALCPFLLTESGFRDPRRWQQNASYASHMPSGDNRLPVASQVKLRNLARATCVLGWYLARTDPIAAKLILDASPECAEVIAQLNLVALQEIADRIVLFRWFKPRWHDRPDVWRRLIQLAQISPRRAFVSVNFRSRQLFLGDALLIE